ncbi:MAG: hypothetical protein HYW07_05655 [Candidatus Latescibacteria bacterium]|nr:hypothetical protein [Candidatus Latescibacterota bacterium]
MSLATRTPTEPALVPASPLAARLRALQDARDGLTDQITAQRAVLELALAQGDEKEAERALVEITLAVHARAVAQRHLERLGSTYRAGLGLPTKWTTWSAAGSRTRSSECHTLKQKEVAT